MPRHPLIVAVLASVLPAAAPAIAITDGLQDGCGHPSVGYVLGTKGVDVCHADAWGGACSAVLIAPDVVLTNIACVQALQDQPPGYIDDFWVVFDPSPLAHTASGFFPDCTKLVPVTGGQESPYGDAAVLFLGAPQ